MKREVRTHDGTGNNLQNPNLGSTNSPLLREGKADYADGISALAGSNRPNPRLISNQLCFPETDTLSPDGLSNLLWAWGQFVDHELDITPGGETEDATIEVPANDVDDEIRAALASVKSASIPFSRSTFVADTGTSEQNPREQINRASSFIDASNVYGSTLYRAQNLRSFQDGKLKSQMIGGDEFPPFNPEDKTRLDNDDGNIRARDAFVAGDIRINEHGVLTAMHALFLREHNRICEQLTNANPNLSDDEAYQLARCRVTGHMQAITLNEFLPLLVGGNRISRYNGYNAHVDPTVSNLFSTATYRLGHSMLPETIPLIDAGGNVELVSLRDLFFQPELFSTGFEGRNVLGRLGYVLKIDDIFRGLMQSNMLRVDQHITESVRSFLFHKTNRSIGAESLRFLDLASLNIQRGRDHGLPDYNQCRRDFGLREITRFAEITNDVEVQSSLRNLYESVDDIDVWIGSLCEDPLPGAAVGELIAASLIDQFTRLRDGDRFWYENDPNLTPDDITEISETRLSDIILRNTGLNVTTGRAFKAHLALNNNDGRSLDIRFYENRLRFSNYESPGMFRDASSDPIKERLFVTAQTKDEKITVSDGKNFIHGLYNLTVDNFTIYQCQQKLLSNEPNDQNLLPAEGTIVVFDENNNRRLLAAGRDSITVPRGWIFNASTGGEPGADIQDKADIFQDGQFTSTYKLVFSDFNTPGIPATQGQEENLVCTRIDDRYLTIDSGSRDLRLIALFTLNLEGKYEVYTFVDAVPPIDVVPSGVDLVAGKEHFKAQGTAVLSKEGDKFRVRVAGHDEEISGRGWIFDATET